MAVQSPPFAQQNAAHSAALFRQAVFGMLHNPFTSSFGGGVLSGVDLLVTAQSTPNMSVQVAPGRAWVPGSQTAAASGTHWSTQAGYFAINDAPLTVTVAAADPSNPRIDTVYIAANDSFYSGGSNNAVIAIQQGAPAPSPLAPTLPNNSLPLANIAVAANATSITSGNITSQLVQVTMRQTCYPCTSSTRPTSPVPGQPIYETDTNRFYRWNPGLGIWQYTGGAAPTVSVPTLTSGWTNGVASGYAETVSCWQGVDGTVYVAALLNGPALSASTAYTPFTLPSGFAPTTHRMRQAYFSGALGSNPQVIRADVLTTGAVTIYTNGAIGAGAQSMIFALWYRP